MKTNSARYIQLLGLLLLSVLSILTVLVILFLGLRLLFNLVNGVPWLVYIFVLLVLSIPAVLFITVFSIFLRRSINHRSMPVRIISYIVSAAVIIFWIIVYVLDMQTFITTSQIDIGKYHSWDTLTLAASVAALFILGIVQALTTEKETDWMERRKIEEI